VVGALVIPASADAAPPQNATCSGTAQTPGMLMSGNYRQVTVSGFCFIPPGQVIAIHGGMTLRAGAQLIGFVTSHQMTIFGGINVRKGAVLGLGCTAEMGCDGSNNNPPSQDVVHGNIVARHALSMYLLGTTVYGNVSFRHGGWGRDCTDPNADDPNDPLGHSLALKDNTFHGTVTVRGWSGCWMGLLRNTVYGSVVVRHNYANQDPANFQGPDSTEIVANVVRGRLACFRNTPGAQFGDATTGAPPGYGPNTVYGRALGECRSLV